MGNGSLKSALALGLCIFAGLTVLGYVLGASAIRFKEYERSVEVKGLSEREVPANVALWPIHFSAAYNDLADLYEILEKDADQITEFLAANGFDRQEITKSPPQITDRLAQGYEKARIEFRYAATQTITVYSEKIPAVREAMNAMVTLGKKGVAFTEGGYHNTTEYLFTRLNDIKPAMVEEATTKARAVAQKFAKDSNSRLGKIKRARQGQFSISDRDKNNPHIKNVRVVSTVEYYLSD